MSPPRRRATGLRGPSTTTRSRKRLLRYGEGKSWRLIETLAANIADTIMIEFRPQAVMVEIKKFPIPQARHVSVTLTRSRPQ